MGLQVSADVKAALQTSKTALAAFCKLPPSHLNEYLKWIKEAKKPDTRQRIERLNTKDAG